jgi:hypothetical protein
MGTKKLLVAYDESKPSAANSDFLAVVFDGMTPMFFGLKSHLLFKSGVMVFIGKEIAVQDIFAKLVESGRKIQNVNETLKNLDAYVQQLAGFKIGNVVSIALKNDGPGFELVKSAEMPKSEAKKLP